MELKYSNSLAGSDKIFNVYLYGTIGEKIDGDEFAKELIYLDHIADQINLHINSPGGNVIEGMSIVSAITAITTPVVAYIEGVGASMAAVIAIACEKVIMYDYAKMMIHDAQYGGGGKLSAKQQKMLTKITDMLRSILSRRGQDEAHVGALMANETWLSADEAQAQGLCDEIIASTKIDYSNLSIEELMDKINNKYQSNQKPMTKLTAKAASMLAVTDQATDNEISDAVEKLNDEKLSAEKRATEVQAKLTAIEDAQKEALKTEAVELVKAAIKDGRLDAKAEKETLQLFEANHESSKTMLASIPPRKPIAGQLVADSSADALINASWDELDKSGKLADLKAKHPDVYAEKFKARFSL